MTASRPTFRLPSAPLHPAEKWLTGIFLVWLLFPPWAFGTMRVIPQTISFALAAIAFLIALYPRELPVDEDGNFRRATPWRTLMRAPLFWIALAFFAYTAVQGLNIHWSWMTDGQRWWLEKREAISWLPAGIEAPFERMNAWRRLLVWGAVFLACCAAWVGLTRRRSLQFLAVAFVINAAVISGLGIAQAASGTQKIFWQFEFVGAAGPFGSFIYKNHAAAFLLIGWCVAGGLANWFHLRGTAHGAKSTPAPVFVFLGAVIGAGIFFSLSRIGMVLAVCGGLLIAGTAARHLLSSRLRFAGFALVVTLVSGGALWAVSRFDFTQIERRLASLSSLESDSSAHLRLQAYEVTRRMIADYPWFGVGAGGFRHLAPAYTQNAHVITQAAGFGPMGGGAVKPMLLNESHSDLLQFTAESGVIGGTILAALLAFVFAAVSIDQRRKHAVGHIGFVSAILILAFAAIDFPLHNPAVLGSLAFSLVIAVRWAELEPSVQEHALH